MARKSTAQVNIRSEFVKQRVGELSRQTGKTATQLVEDAVRAYKPSPPADDDEVPAGMVRKGKFLVFKGTGDGRVITLDDTNRAILADRTRNIWGDDED